jgi:hypothetical protein
VKEVRHEREGWNKERKGGVPGREPAEIKLIKPPSLACTVDLRG